MKLHPLFCGIEVREIVNDANPVITGIGHDSRAIKPGELYCCIPGTKLDGHAYAADAVARGAAALLAERPLPGLSVPQVICADVRAAMALASANYFGKPAANLTLLGVTGTNGKTTVTHMLESIGRAAGHQVGLIGTNYIRIGDQTLPAHATTPDPFELHGLLRQMADANVTWVVMEVSAHALWLRKTVGLTFSVGVFTNFSQDHLDDFGTMEAYLQAKTRLFEKGTCRAAVLSADDPAVRELAGKLTIPYLTFGLNPDADVRAAPLEYSLSGLRLRLTQTLCGAESGVDINVPLPGAFTALNAGAAGAAALSLGLPLAVVRHGLQSMPGVPGRMELVPDRRRQKRGAFFVDYACTPDALIQALTAARPLTRGRLGVVFGCGGDRDRQKRPLMGAACAQYADYCIVTSDNPRTEDPLDIIGMITQGMPDNCPRHIEPDRRAALAHAVSWAEDNDVVLVEGKGHEDYQEIKGVRHPFSDREELERLLRDDFQPHRA